VSASQHGGFVGALIVPGLPQPLLTPDACAGYRRLRGAFDAARARIAAWAPDLLVVYSTMWPSILGHQVQADPNPRWTHVDELFHELGSIPYDFRVDAGFAAQAVGAMQRRGLHARTVAYHGFPIDTGSVVALSLLTPRNEVPAVIVSSNVYADRAETIVLGKATGDAVRDAGRRAVAVAVSTLSNRLFTDFVPPEQDRVHSAKDDEWNRKILEFLAAGRLEDVAQLSRAIQKQIRVKKVVNFKPMWWLSAAVGAHNRYRGDVLGYEGVFGTGSAVVALEPAGDGVGDREFDEEDVERWRGDRSVLEGAGQGRRAGRDVEAGGDGDEARVDAGEVEPGDIGADGHPDEAAVGVPNGVGAGDRDRGERQRSGGEDIAGAAIRTETAAKPIGAYPHARRVDGLLFLSGVGPRQPGTNEIPGGPVRDPDGHAQPYDVAAQTRAVYRNVEAILRAAGSDPSRIVDVTVFLIDMQRDFAAFNAVWAEVLGGVEATRTTIEVRALPTPIAVEWKVVARP
jgi:enamine deaminase RidA (YjgF/YER057c/UK114 family)/aromatic ring-opening dioxygenase catalytic subunit (LigB family)